jgi:hypothetical protein
MASKTQEAKDAQGYTKKPQQCNNCANYKSEMVHTPASPENWRGAYNTEKNKRCGIGGFAVQSSASCKIYAAG